MPMDSVEAYQAAADAVENGANVPNVVVVAVVVHDTLNAVTVAQQRAGQHFD